MATVNEIGFRRLALLLDLNVLRWLVRNRRSRVYGTIPTVPVEALSTEVGDGGPSSIETSQQDCAAYTSRPLKIKCAVTHCGNVVTVLDD